MLKLNVEGGVNCLALVPELKVKVAAGAEFTGIAHHCDRGAGLNLVSTALE